MPTKKKPTAVYFPTIVGPDGYAPAFACGNHQPSHLAKSLKQLMKLSQTYGCRRFHMRVATAATEVAPPAGLPTFICGNHHPQHIANSMSELMSLRTLHGCADFKAVHSFSLIPE